MMRLVIVSQEASAAQREYQRARVTPGAISSLFYKDATPRADHFLECTVKLIGREHWPWHSPIPLRLSLCYDDGTPTVMSDQGCLRVLSLSSHVKAAIPADDDCVSFSYRIELGSFRRADRSFAVKVEVSDPLAEGKHVVVDPCLTPPVYVLSKKKIEPGVPQAPRPVKRKVDESDDSDDSAAKRTKSSKDDSIVKRLDALESRVQELANLIQTFTSRFSAFPPRDEFHHYPDPRRPYPHEQGGDHHHHHLVKPNGAIGAYRPLPVTN